MEEGFKVIYRDLLIHKKQVKKVEQGEIIKVLIQDGTNPIMHKVYLHAHPGYPLVWDYWEGEGSLW